VSRLLLTLGLLFATGCTSTGLESLGVTDLPLVKEKKAEVPTRVIPVWTDTVLHRGGKTVRGFGGRVIFYGSKEDTPIEIDGAVIVYAWDDTAGRGQEAPDRKYMFKADTMAKHYSPSKIGHSYSFWLPWDAVGGETKHITLVTRFVSVAGGEVTSNAANVVLPGQMGSKQKDPLPDTVRPTATDLEPQRLGTYSRQQPIQQLGFEELTPLEEPSSRREPTTIDLPLHLARGSQAETSVVGAGVTDRKSLTVADFETSPILVPVGSESDAAAEASQVRASSRFGPRTLPVRSSRSNRRFSSREQIRPDRLESRRGSSRKQRSPHVSVQKKIAQDAAEAKARRAEVWGQYQATGRDRD